MDKRLDIGQLDNLMDRFLKFIIQLSKRYQNITIRSWQLYFPFFGGPGHDNLSQVRKILTRVFLKAKVQPESLVGATFYLQQFVKMNQASITSQTFCKLALCAIITAEAMINDGCAPIGWFAVNAYLSPQQLQSAMTAFLSHMDYQLLIDNERYQQGLQQLSNIDLK